MPRPVVETITFNIDGRDVEAPAGAMLVDAAKINDVEIPVFCYEPKLGPPVGACRMCLVEIEGIPKLQTACSTPVRDGMVVHTQTDRVHAAQNAVVEFLLINHPLDCPVCDKGGECPLQDITYGWGPGTSRFIEPKRHFEKPLELSPLIAIDRERCILCYRCVRFSQEIAEDYQLVLSERGAHSYVSTFDGHPYVAPFSGNIIELCPVGALTSKTYRFRARPWDIEGSGSVCTLCPAQCNVEFTVRDDRVMRVASRHNEHVDDGWLCDKGRFAYQHVHVDERITEPLVRDASGRLQPVGWEVALRAAADALTASGPATAAIAAGETTNEEGFFAQRLLRDGLGSSHLSARPGGELPAELRRALLSPTLGATVADLEFAHTVLLVDTDPIDDAPVLDLRIRKGHRRNGLKVVVASSRPTALDPNASVAVRFAPGGAEGLLVALDAALAGDGALPAAAEAVGADVAQVEALAAQLRDGGQDVVIMFGERVADGARGADAVRALLNVAAHLGLAERPGSGLIEIPSSTNGRGLAEVGFAGASGVGLAALDTDGSSAQRIVDGLADGSLSTLLLLHADPLRTHPDRARWTGALEAATTVVAFDSVMTDTVREHADVVFPAESYAEKEGTLTHPDGRLQRLRPAIGRPKSRTGAPDSGVRPVWQVLAELSTAVGLQTRVLTGGMASRQVFDAVPFYAGLTLDIIGGRGVRWPELPAAEALAAADLEAVALREPFSIPKANGALRLGRFRSLWSSKEVDVSPALQFVRPRQSVELSPIDAERLGIAQGDQVQLGEPDGPRIQGAVRLREAVPAGSVFVIDGTRTESANVLTDALVHVRRIGGATSTAPSGMPAVVQPAVEGLAQMPESAPLMSPPGTGPATLNENGSV